jgi:hypothetical protein
LGFSLSDNRRTPNIIFTYKEKNNEIISKRINRFIFLSFLALFGICIFTLIYQGSKLNILKNNNASLKKELSLYSPILSVEKVIKTADEIKIQKKNAHQYAQKYSGLAAIGEVSNLTPENVRLISFKLTEGSPVPKTDADKTATETTANISIEGIISGNKDMLESDLTQYVVKLENSPLFNKISVQKKDMVTFNKGEGIHFILSVKIG